MGGRRLPDTTVASGWLQPSAVPLFFVYIPANIPCVQPRCVSQPPFCKDVGFVQERRTSFQLCEVVQVVVFFFLSFFYGFLWLSFFMAVRSWSWTGTKKAKAELLWVTLDKHICVEIVLV